MLGKLIKHEWKATWIFPSFICIFIILITVISCGVFSVLFSDLSLLNGTTAQHMTLLLLYLLSFFFLFFSYIVIIIYFIYRFYKNLFTREGYLTHTLPTTAGNLILSKLFCSVTWLLITSFLSLSGFIALFYTTVWILKPHFFSYF